jgi:signal transduction histidine kinase
MQEIARIGLHELRSFRDALPQSPTTLGDLAEGMLIIAGRTAGLAGAKLSLEIHDGADVVVSGESRTVLVRVFHEAVLNAVRHGAAKQIKASLEVTDRVLKLRVMDDGMGFAIEAPTGGFGLAGMKERAHEFGGSLQVSTVPGTGTTIELALPMGER